MWTLRLWAFGSPFHIRSLRKIEVAVEFHCRYFTVIVWPARIHVKSVAHTRTKYIPPEPKPLHWAWFDREIHLTWVNLQIVVASMVGRCSHCCSIMNTRVDVNDLEINSRIRVGDSDVSTVKYIGEVISAHKIVLILTDTHQPPSPSPRNEAFWIVAQKIQSQHALQNVCRSILN